jgi:hypothetical protein
MASSSFRISVTSSSLADVSPVSLVRGFIALRTLIISARVTSSSAHVFLIFVSRRRSSRSSSSAAPPRSWCPHAVTSASHLRLNLHTDQLLEVLGRGVLLVIIVLVTLAIVLVVLGIVLVVLVIVLEVLIIVLVVLVIVLEVVLIIVRPSVISSSTVFFRMSVILPLCGG